MPGRGQGERPLTAAPNSPRCRCAYRSPTFVVLALLWGRRFRLPTGCSQLFSGRLCSFANTTPLRSWLRSEPGAPVSERLLVAPNLAAPGAIRQERTWTSRGNRQAACAYRLRRGLSPGLTHGLTPGSLREISSLHRLGFGGRQDCEALGSAAQRHHSVGLAAPNCA
jgi:hypothetical protein